MMKLKIEVFLVSCWLYANISIFISHINHIILGYWLTPKNFFILSHQFCRLHKLNVLWFLSLDHYQKKSWLKPWGKQLKNQENLKKMWLLSWKKSLSANYYLNLLPTTWLLMRLLGRNNIYKIKVRLQQHDLVVEYWIYKIRLIFVKFLYIFSGVMLIWQKLSQFLKNKGVETLKLLK